MIADVSDPKGAQHPEILSNSRDSAQMSQTPSKQPQAGRPYRKTPGFLIPSSRHQLGKSPKIPVPFTLVSIVWSQGACWASLILFAQTG